MNSDIPAALDGSAAGEGQRAGQRGRPRSPEADRAILAAALDLLASRGLAAMSIEEVAARAGVGKATIYRRWPSKGLLALDAFVAAFREQQPPPDTGTLRGDLVAALTAWVRLVTQTPMGPMLTGLIAEAQHDPGLRAAWRDRVLEPLRSQHRLMLDRAIARGELPATVDQEVVLDLFFGAAQHRLLLGHLPLTDDFISSLVDVILNGIRPRLGRGSDGGRRRSGVWLLPCCALLSVMPVMREFSCDISATHHDHEQFWALFAQNYP